MLKTEEDVRSKVVMSWLATHGFTPSDIQVERSFELRVGHSVLRVGEKDPQKARVNRPLHPRADVLVRHVDGRNLLVVEVKAPGEPLDDDARDQGISYARLLREGGIAPFVILTDGEHVRLFDSITGDEIAGEAVPSDHRYAKSGFRVTGEHSDLRAEALERLVSLDPSNLVEFCRAQVEFRIRKLKHSDPLSGRKYIPDLYIERPDAQRRLDELITQGKRVILVVGPPQVGKTNLICHTVDRRLELGEPTLFYPAIMVGGLAAELREDFEWTLRQDVGSDAVVADRLTRVARASGCRIVVFIDGWNEAALSAARSIDTAAERIASDQITFVISLTDVAARRLLTDAVGDPAFAADAAGIPVQDLIALEIRNRRLPKSWSVVLVEKYDAEESKIAIETYSRLLNVSLPDWYQPITDPLLLRTVMLSCSGGSLPRSVDEPAFFGKHIETKLTRARLRDARLGKPMLVDAAEELLTHGAPASEGRLLSRWGIPLHEGLPEGFVEAALLIRRTSDGTEEQMGAAECAGDGVDFYMQRERDYVIAYWLRKWPRSLRDDQATAEMERAVATEIGRGALSWFLQQATNRDLLKARLAHFSEYEGAQVRRVLIGADTLLSLGRSSDAEVLEDTIRAGLRDPDADVRLATAATLAELDSHEHQELKERLAGDTGIISDLLQMHLDYPLSPDSAGGTVLSALHTLHAGSYNSYVDFEWETDVTRVLARLAEAHNLEEAALLAFGYIAPHTFMSWMGSRLQHRKKRPKEEITRYLGALENAIERMTEVLYYAWGREGGLTTALHERAWDGEPNAVERRKEQRSEHRREYRKFRRIYEPVIRRFEWHPTGQALQQFLVDLKPEEDKKAAETRKQRMLHRRDQAPRPRQQVKQLGLEFDS